MWQLWRNHPNRFFQSPHVIWNTTSAVRCWCGAARSTYSRGWQSGRPSVSEDHFHKIPWENERMFPLNDSVEILMYCGSGPPSPHLPRVVVYWTPKDQRGTVTHWMDSHMSEFITELIIRVTSAKNTFLALSEVLSSAWCPHWVGGAPVLSVEVWN